MFVQFSGGELNENLPMRSHGPPDVGPDLLADQLLKPDSLRQRGGVGMVFSLGEAQAKLTCAGPAGHPGKGKPVARVKTPASHDRIWMVFLHTHTHALGSVILRPEAEPMYHRLLSDN